MNNIQNVQLDICMRHVMISWNNYTPFGIFKLFIPMSNQEVIKSKTKNTTL